MEIKNKIAVVTGATGGIGKEVTFALAREGSSLILIARNKDKLDKLSKEAKKLGAIDVKIYTVDLRDLEAINKVTQSIKKNFDRVDYLFNVAGIGVYKEYSKVTQEEWDNSVAVNVTAPYFLIQQLLPLLKNSADSVVVNLGSGMGVIPLPERSVYNATKFALRGMSLSLSKELEPKNVKIMHVQLGSTLTNFGPMSVEEKKKLQEDEGKRYFTPEWVAKKFMEIIKEDKIQDEITLFPSHYIEDELELS